MVHKVPIKHLNPVKIDNVCLKTYKKPSREVYFSRFETIFYYITPIEMHHSIENFIGFQNMFSEFGCYFCSFLNLIISEIILHVHNVCTVHFHRSFLQIHLMITSIILNIYIFAILILLFLSIKTTIHQSNSPNTYSEKGKIRMNLINRVL